ncbi:hypothetical protein RvY_02127 [Ramazzottius varieornatus]|uniref:G-protein coupled receptors family 1 profile domain-containing protein n=1 Tax=Ramazzottius varieornatus TaxID=947166 RepID=A0A1D1UT97_RAMVA|nr:hypothetical protein RvY_02127 [Ramazzottius varieornatus]
MGGWNNSSMPPALDADRVHEGSSLWALTLIGILIFITVVANFFVILLFFVSSHLRTPFNYYLLNIAVNDFLTGAIDMPYYAFFTYYGYWPLSDIHCTIWMFFDFSVPFASLWGVVTVSLDRFWAVTWPLSYRHHNTVKKAFILIAAGWFINYSAMLPGYVYTRLHYANQSANRTCLWDVEGIPAWALNFPVVVVDIFTPMVLTAVFYILIAIRIRKSALQRRAQPLDELGQVSAIGSRRKKQRDRQAFLVLTALVVAFVAAWLPWVVCQALILITGEDYAVFLAVTYWTSYGLSGLNPFMFGIASGDLRKAVQHFTRWKSRTSPEAVSTPYPFSGRPGSQN